MCIIKSSPSGKRERMTPDCGHQGWDCLVEYWGYLPHLLNQAFHGRIYVSFKTWTPSTVPVPEKMLIGFGQMKRSYFPPLRLWSQWNKLQSKKPKIRSRLLKNVEWSIESNTNHPVFLGPFCDPLSFFPREAKQVSILFPFDLVQLYEISLREKRKYYPESSDGSRT